MKAGFFGILVFGLLACSSDLKNKNDGGLDGSIPTDGSVDPIEGGGGKDAGDAGMPRTPHRLFVGSAGGVNGPVVAWDDVDLITQDRAADVVLSLNGKVPSLEVADTRLFAFNNADNMLYAYDDAAKLTGASQPALKLGGSGLVGTPAMPRFSRMLYSPPLLISSDVSSSAVQLFKNPTQTSMASARMGALNEPFSGIARDPKTDRVFGGQVGQQVIKFADNASTTTGQTSIADFSGAPFQPWVMAADDARLYALGNTGPQLQINIYTLSAIKPGSQPDLVVSAGLPMNANALDMVLVNDVLVVSYENAGTGAVLVYPNAKSLIATATGAPLTTSPITGNRMRLSAKTGLLYVAGSYNGAPAVTVWSNLTTTPALKATITSNLTSPFSLALYEP